MDAVHFKKIKAREFGAEAQTLNSEGVLDLNATSR
jgi:hypothetical protein